MSLKARIEAVIYAAEEPVTLAQLATLFHEEALERKRDRESASAAPQVVEAEAAIASEPGIAAYEGEEQAGDAPASVRGDATQREASGSPDAEAAVPASEDETRATEDEKRTVRLREREAREELRRILNELVSEYSSGDRGMEVREIAGGYRIATKPEYHDSVRAFVKALKPAMKLSLQALETLAIIAYKQPVTAPEVGEIRGVDSAGVLGSLISRKLVTTAGRKQVIGRPILYKTTKEFLLRFGLKDLNELPSMEEFEKMAGELSDSGELPFAQNEMAEIEDASRENRAWEDDAPTLLEEAQTAGGLGNESIAVGVSDESGVVEDVPGVCVPTREGGANDASAPEPDGSGESV